MIEDVEKRRQRNADIVRRLKQGEALMDDPKKTWFPERPQIKKDPNLVAALYCSQGHDWIDGKCKTCGKQDRKLVLLSP